MSGWILRASITAVRRWTWLYTLPLELRARDTRRREIESDLWESLHDLSPSDSRAALAVHVLLRAALGIPDDLLWVCEQRPDNFQAPSLFAVGRLAIVAAVVSGLVVSASGPRFDPARTLQVNVQSTGWIAIARRPDRLTVMPSITFSLTNRGSDSTKALQINAIFHGWHTRDAALGSAFSPVVGWHGLGPGATSRMIVLPPETVRTVATTRIQAAALRDGLDPDVAVAVYVRHAGRWTLLGDYPIRPQALHTEP